ncbi:MAG TPA: bifunctional methylenetetrahydrofolate dehydrogenase/methenyltetrahydrofolate cyclohydrolase FolD [Blastocatellia bacterium]|nr:bifunctional methylenetetrahydrofolate dehydrogenase/methenyltetrahydrofolate cyclohydrolase FolD [Blastocatellia bacterium]
MSAQLLDGTFVASQIKQGVAARIQELSARGIRPGLAVVLVGHNPASVIYVNGKVKTCESLGIYSEKHELPEETTTEQLLALIDDLNRREEIDGILVQTPLPRQIDTRRILDAIDPARDVDGFHPVNVGKLVRGEETLVACTPAGIIEMLEHYRIPIAGAGAVVIGRSDIVGKPMALLLLHRHATVTICHSRTRNLAEVARRADILIAAIGRTAMVTADFVKEGAVVVDVGMNNVTTVEEAERIFTDAELPRRRETLAKRGYTLTGDVEQRSVIERAGWLTPVPGGVGPLTIAMLMKNTVRAAEARRG